MKTITKDYITYYEHEIIVFDHDGFEQGGHILHIINDDKFIVEFNGKEFVKTKKQILYKGGILEYGKNLGPTKECIDNFRKELSNAEFKYIPYSPSTIDIILKQQDIINKLISKHIKTDKNWSDQDMIDFIVFIENTSSRYKEQKSIKELLELFKNERSNHILYAGKI